MTGARVQTGPPPPRPPLRAVAEQVLELEKFIDPECAVLLFLRAIPALAGVLNRVEAERHYRELRLDGVGVVEAQRVVAARLGVSERSLRLWGLNG